MNLKDIKFNSSNAEVYIPVNAKPGKCAYLAVAAHQDDVEIMAADGIFKAFDSADKSFCAVIVTDGAGSAREGIYADYTDDMMKRVRASEQRKAAEVGSYGGLVSLNYTSAQIKDAANTQAAEDIAKVIRQLAPEVVYTHNLCDKHDTHIGVAAKLIAAVRSLPKQQRPQKLYGCEVWRGLDWLMDDEKVLFDLSSHLSLSNALLGVFDSQIAGGKRYDLATDGRRLANATYSSSHAVDASSHVGYAMDLTPLILDDTADIGEFAAAAIDRFRADVLEKVTRMTKCK